MKARTEDEIRLAVIASIIEQEQRGEIAPRSAFFMVKGVMEDYGTQTEQE